MNAKRFTPTSPVGSPRRNARLTWLTDFVAIVGLVAIVAVISQALT